jgi:hypothetical protein
VPRSVAEPAAIGVPRLPARYSIRNLKELSKVLEVIEGEAIAMGGASASLRGVTSAYAEKVFEKFVPGDLFELRPRDLYYVIARGARAGKSRGTIAAELKGM